VHKFDTLRSSVIPLGMANVDTDTIIPARFLRKPREGGFGGFCFHDLRHREDGTRADVVLNDPRYHGAAILAAGMNFGCGSSREGAVWALMDHGFRVVIAPSFADIFLGNSVKNGLLAVRLAADEVQVISDRAAAEPTATWVVSLPEQSVVSADGAERYHFDIDAFHKRCLVEGLLDVDLAHAAAGDIDRLYRARVSEIPGMLPKEIG
jgi:3-isopropylmalate/(R)-2-methylmalate dehydratase small subunit